ncbi:MAG: hypothetical protein HDR38_06185 [Treponema sp.]|nr:hypothetical protein [Treponema sp.]
MKKICGKKLAFLLAACVLAAGTFVSCGEDEPEDPTAADSLAKPVGDDPFTTGNYTALITATEKDEEYTYTRCYTIDTEERTVSIFYDEDEEVPSQQKKYTYNDKTITLALYKAYMPSDMDAYIAHLIEDKEYTGDWKLAGKSEYISAMERVVKEESSVIEKRLKDTTISTDEREYLQERLDYLKNSAVAGVIEMFNESVVYEYSKTGNVITLTNDAAEDKKLVLTPASN